MSSEKITVRIDPDIEALIPGFLGNREKDVQSLKEALGDENYRSMRSIGHNLKGVAGGYGFDGMSRIGADIETAAGHQDIKALASLIEQLDEYMKNLAVVFAE